MRRYNEESKYVQSALGCAERERGEEIQIERERKKDRAERKERRNGRKNRERSEKI